MKNTRTDEQIMKRCEFLESLGFVCHHNDVCVSHKAHEDLMIDFSAVNMEVSDVIAYTIHRIFEQGYLTGKEHLRENIKGLLGIEGYGDE